MKPTRIPISLCHANCPKCGMPSDFRCFESGAGGDFATVRGVATGAYYRIDLAKTHYGNASKSDLLAKVEAKEGGVRHIPEEIKCRICGTTFSAHSIQVDGEELIDAYML